MKKTFMKFKAAVLYLIILISISSIVLSEANSKKELPNTDPYPIPYETEVKIIKSDKYGIIIENCINLEDINFNPEDIDDKTFHKLSIKNYGYTNEIGKPMLPTKEILVAIPEEIDINLNILSSSYKSYYNYLIYPVPKSIEKTTKDGYSYIEEEFYIDDIFYSKNIYYPSPLAKIEKIFYIRDQRVVRILFNPFIYNPEKQHLKSYFSVKIELKYSSPTILELNDVGPLKEICSKSILNYKKNDKEPSNNQNGNVTYPKQLASPTNKADYLIITSDEFYNPARQDYICRTQNNRLNELAYWRSQYNSYDVAVVNVNDSFIGGNNDSLIKNFIEYVYNNWTAPHMTDGHVGYILLVGDTPFVTSHNDLNHENRSYVSDRWFVCLDNDSLPDVLIGRFSVDNYSQLDIMGNKTIQYEQNPIPGDWHKKVLLAEGTWAPFYEYYFMKDILLEYSGYEVFEAIKRYGSTDSDVVDPINNGTVFVHYCGHGGTSGWESGMGLHSGDIADLTNDGKLPVVISVACKTGLFQDSYNCFGEFFVNTKGRGAIAFYGASTLGGNPKFSYFSMKTYFEDFEYQLGKIISYLIYQTSGSNPEYNLLGDPALDISGKTAFPNKPDLAISHLNISIDPENPTNEDQVVNITADILNIGGSNASDVFVQFRVIDPFGYENIIGEQNISQINSLGYVTLYETWNVSNEIGKKSVIIEIDPLNLIDESFKLNNQAGIKVNPFLRDILYVDDDNTDGPWNGTLDFPYKYIQDAVDCVSESGTIVVFNGYYVNPNMYKEQVHVTKSVNIIGEDPEITIIDADGSDICFWIEFADNIKINGFTIKNASEGLYIEACNNVEISNNIIIDCHNSNHLIGVYYSNVIDNIMSCFNGTYLQKSDHNIISNNYYFENVKSGIVQEYGIENIIIKNIFENNQDYGLHIDINAKNNIIYHNNFINNTVQAFDNCRNIWNYSYPEGGNYWDDFDEEYEGAYDDYYGPEQDHLGSDGIVDQGKVNYGGINPYNISGKDQNQDIYPLIDLFDTIIPRIYFETIQRNLTVKYGLDIGGPGDERLDVGISKGGILPQDINVTLYVKGLTEDNWSTVKDMPYIRELYRGNLTADEIMNYYDDGHDVLVYMVKAVDPSENVGVRPNYFEEAMIMFTIMII